MRARALREVGMRGWLGRGALNEGTWVTRVGEVYWLSFNHRLRFSLKIRPSPLHSSA